MVTLTFNFNYDKIREAGTTTDELLAPMRAHAKEYGIDEIDYGVFAKDGIKALGAIEKYVIHVSKEYLEFLDTWILDANGEVEDCKACLLRCMEKYKKYKRFAS